MGGCVNCGAPLAGRYCAACGQRVEPRIQPLSHFVREAFEVSTHVDSRLWRTLLPLLLRPGHLTAEFLRGRRASYLPPFRLYLVITLLFFLLVAALAVSGSIEVRVAVPTASAADTADTASRCRLTYSGPGQSWMQPRLEAACRRLLADQGRGASEKFLQNMPNAMFFFLPFLALVMKLVYRRPKRYYVEHLLFFIHNHAFAFLFSSLWLLASLVVPEGAATTTLRFAAFVYLIWYFYRSMRRVYGEGRLETLAKFTVLGFTYVLSGAAMLLLTAVVSAIAAP